MVVFTQLLDGVKLTKRFAECGNVHCLELQITFLVCTRLTIILHIRDDFVRKIWS